MAENRVISYKLQVISCKLQIQIWIWICNLRLTTYDLQLITYNFCIFEHLLVNASQS